MRYNPESEIKMSKGNEAANENREKIFTYVAVILTFLLSFAFFYFIRPLGIYDSDDWNYISILRIPLPDPHQWNPTRVLPETWLSLLGYLSAHSFFLILHDYIQSLTLTLAIFVSAMVCILGNFVMSILRKIHKQNSLCSALLWFFLLLSGMLIYNKNVGCPHLFWAEDVTCVFYYTVPGILNAITILYIMIKRYEGKLKINLILIFLLYFCINSNMYSSILLVAYLSSESVVDFFGRIGKDKIGTIIKDNLFTIVIDIIWIISVILETMGGRAKMLGATNTGFDVVGTAKSFVFYVMGMNKVWLVINFLLIVGAFAYAIRMKNEKCIKLYIAFFIEIFVTTVYVILLCAKVNPEYVTDSKTLFPILISVEILAVISFGELITALPKIRYILPLITIACAVLVCTYIPYYRYYNPNQLTYEQSKRVNDDIISQILAADENGLDEVVVYIPKHASQEWPLSIYYGGQSLAQAFYRHGLVENVMKITLVPSVEKNSELGVD